MFSPEYFTPVLDQAIPVRLAARAFLIPVPINCGSPMAYPFYVEGGRTIKAGMPILDKEGKEKGTGIVFINHTDGAVQAAKDDGKSMIIVNGLSPVQANALMHYYQSLVLDSDKANKEQISEVLRFAHEDLGIDDFYNGSQSKISGFEVERLNGFAANCGIFIRRSQDERFAMIGLGSGIFAGPASSPQRFTDNVVVVKNDKHAWMVQTADFLKTYRHPDDREIEIGQLPAFTISEGKSPVRVPCLAA
jgi:hypothetical protein